MDPPVTGVRRAPYHTADCRDGHRCPAGVRSAAMAKQKIAVLGGGIGALSALYAITSQDSWADRYDITVYQVGWRLGGKGATGRDRQRADRILEHGYHMPFGLS